MRVPNRCLPPWLRDKGASTKEAPVSPFIALLVASGLPEPVTEYRFHPSRKWRFDYCWPEEKVALEVEGGVWIGGRHNRGSGFLKDLIKYNAAAIAGYRVLRCTPKEIRSGAAVGLVKEILGGGDGTDS